jgi:MFS family permease
MDSTVARSGKPGAFDWLHGITRYQWMIFFVTWAGWALDVVDFTLFALVLRTALGELMGSQASLADIGRVGGILGMTGLLGWAVGGFVFGMVADHFGRVRTLALSIIIYSVFTAAQGFAQTPLQLGVFRFIAGLGTGAELMVGIPLVAEAFAKENRAKIAGIMMTGGAVGTLIAGFLYGILAPYGWRIVFFAGILPALLLVFFRKGLVEPDRFTEMQERRAAAVAAGPGSEAQSDLVGITVTKLFGPKLIYNTMVGLMFAVGSLLAIWTSNIWLPTIQSLMLEKEGIKGAEAVPYVARGMMLFGLGGIGGYAAFGFIADRIGRKPTVVLYSLGTVAAGLWLYLGLSTWTYYPLLLPVFGFFVFGVFSGHAIYLPELFPTHVRATAVAFCNGTGRIITSFGPLVAGLLVSQFGGNFNLATAVITCFALLSVVAMFLGRETKGDDLPE